MPDLKLLQEELEQTLERRTSIRDKHKGDVLPPDVRADDEQLHERGLKLQQLIEAEKTAIRDKDFEGLQKYMTDPQYKIPRAVDDDDQGKKAIMGAGWEVKSGIVSRHTSIGEHQMYPEAVLFGPLPDDPVASSFFRLTRAAMQPDYRAAYLKFLEQVARTKSEAIALNSLTPSEQKALSEGQDAAGGFLVPPDIQAEIFARTAQQSVMRNLCRVVNTSRDRIVWPRVEPHGSSGSIYSSAFVGAFVGETPTQSDVDPAFGQMEISVRKIRAATKLGNDMISDAIANIPSFLAQDGAQNIALVEDNGFLNGQGLASPALEPAGLLQDGGVSTVDVEGSTANTISNTTSSTGSAPKIIDVAYGLPSQYVRNAQWLFRRAIEGKIRKLVDGSGRFLWPPMIASGFANVIRELLGSPVNNSDFVPNDGTDTNKVIIYGDFSAYIIAQRAMITTTILRERYADTDQTGIILWERVGGGLSNPDAFRFGVV